MVQVVDTPRRSLECALPVTLELNTQSPNNS
jgi:hypothetical protein